MLTFLYLSLDEISKNERVCLVALNLSNFLMMADLLTPQKSVFCCRI